MATFRPDTPLNGLDLLTVMAALEHFDLRQYMAGFAHYDLRRDTVHFNRLCLRCMCLQMSLRGGDGRSRALEGVKLGTLVVQSIEPRGDEECTRCSILPAPLDRRPW